MNGHPICWTVDVGISGVKKLRTTLCPPYKQIGCYGVNNMTSIRADGMYNVSSLSWIGLPNISSQGPCNIWHRYPLRLLLPRWQNKNKTKQKISSFILILICSCVILYFIGVIYLSKISLHHFIGVIVIVRPILLLKINVLKKSKPLRDARYTEK